MRVMTETDEMSESEYAKSISYAELRHVVLLKSNFFVNPEFFSESSDRELSRGEEITSFSVTEDRLTAAAEIEYFAKAKCGEAEAFCASCTYLVAFDFEKETTEETAEKVIQRVGRFAAYPFFRQHVAQLSWESGIDIPILPIIKQRHQASKSKRLDDVKDKP